MKYPSISKLTMLYYSFGIYSYNMLVCYCEELYKSFTETWLKLYFNFISENTFVNTCYYICHKNGIFISLTNYLLT